MEVVMTFEIKLDLTMDELDKLVEILTEYDDCGPHDQGWQSKEIISIAEKLKAHLSSIHKSLIHKSGAKVE
jgi:hypothetical protein